MLRRFAFCCSSLLLLASAATLAAQPFQWKQFSADMKITSRKGVSTGKVFFGNHKIRSEVSMMGHDAIMVVDPERKVMDMLMPQQHMYMENSLDKPNAHKTFDWHSYDPSNPCATTPEKSCQALGAESVNGRMCNKWQFSEKNGSSSSIEWIDQQLGFPIKTQSTDGDVWELLNVKLGPQDPSLFQIPPGYNKMDFGNMMQMQGMPGMQRPPR